MRERENKTGRIKSTNDDSERLGGGADDRFRYTRLTRVRSDGKRIRTNVGSDGLAILKERGDHPRIRSECKAV